MMPRLQAEEALDAATAAALGAGTLKHADAHRLWASLRRRAAPAPAPKADRRILALMGIEVVDA
jgi:hypothetical protein